MRLGISARLSILTIATVMIATILVATAMVRVAEDIARDALVKRGETLIRMLNDSAENALLLRDELMVQRMFGLVTHEEAVQYVALYDSLGRLIACHGHDWCAGLRVLRLPSAEQGGDIVHSADKPEATRPLDYLLTVRAGGNMPSSRYALVGEAAGDRSPVMGYVRMGVNQAEYRDAVNRAINTTTVFVLIVVGLAVIVIFWLTRRIVLPLRSLAIASAQVARGEYDQHMVLQRPGVVGEVGELADAFQKMVGKLRESRARVLEYQHLLEERVQRRTEELHRATEEAILQASHDSLTGLANRAVFMTALESELRIAQESDGTFGVIFIDLDRFKRINDTKGHVVGDLVLKHVAERLRRSLRSSDLLARFGGDEFVVLARQGDNHEIGRLAQRLLEAMESPIVINGQGYQLGASIGICMYPRDGMAAADLLKHADIAMFSAKEAGRGGVRFFVPEMNARIVERISIEDGLLRALDAGEFHLEYQPQFDLSSNSIACAEALLRWDDPVRGLVAPGVFVPIAEDCGLIVQIGEWVLRQACRCAASWHAKGQYLRIAVNISAMQFERSDFSATVQRALQEAGLPPQYLELELTESAIVRNAEEAQSAMLQLKALGVSIALDDFGTGYSSLSYLSRLPFDVIKIDRSFVAAVLGDENARTIVRSIIALAGSLGCKVVAEGVENAAQYDWLRDYGCTAVQGYLLAQPCEPEVLADLAITTHHLGNSVH